MCLELMSNKQRNFKYSCSVPSVDLLSSLNLYFCSVTKLLTHFLFVLSCLKVSYHYLNGEGIITLFLWPHKTPFDKINKFPL